MNLQKFTAAAELSKARLRKDHLDAMNELAHVAFERLVETSPVLTGQYRASHRVSANVAAESFEERPSKGTVLPPPPYNGPADLAFGESVILSNAVPHAVFLEYGTARMDPRRVYELASMVVEQEAERLADAVGR